MQPAVGVFLGDGDHETQVGLDHFLLGLTGLFFAFLHLLHDAAEFRDIQTDVLAHLRHVGAQLFDLFGRTLDEHLPATARLFAHFRQPVRIQFSATIGLDKFTTVDAGLVGQLHHGTVNLHDPTVDAVQLVDQRINPVVMQMQPVHQLNNFRAQGLIGCLVALGERAVFVQGGRNPAVLHFR